MVRVRNAYFGFAKMNHEIEKQRFRNGFERDFSNELKEQFTLEARSIPYEVLKYYAVNVFQSDDILVTDYNVENPNKITNQAVVLASGVEPNYEGAGANQSVLITFEDRFNNRIKRYF
jgi:pyruvate/2-oxoglutarate dehydrogenase complex dihydrolipoamide dehydrogenase (E3) component